MLEESHAGRMVASFAEKIHYLPQGVLVNIHACLCISDSDDYCTNLNLKLNLQVVKLLRFNKIRGALQENVCINKSIDCDNISLNRSRNFTCID